VAPADPVPTDRWALGASVVAVIGVAAQWTAWTRATMGAGMTAYDTVFYHSPIAARFAQTGNLAQLHSVVPGEAVTFYPATTEAWHAIGMVAFRSDVASPVLNLACLVVGLLAAWCVGRAFGSVPAAVALTALVFATPVMGASQPGSSFSDAPGLAALLASVALLTRVPRNRGASVVAALAAGLAAGMKFSYLAPAALIALAAVTIAPRGRRIATGAGWIAVMLVSGGYWYARNLVRIGNPLPGVNIGLPSPAFPVDDRFGGRLLTGLDLSAHGWHAMYYVGLRDYFGRAWPLMLTLIIAGVAGGLALWRHSSWHRAVAVTALLSFVAYGLTPVAGDRTFFPLNLRYTLAVQGMAVLLLATHPRLRGRWPQRALVALSLIGMALAWPRPRPGHTDPFQVDPWPLGHRLAGVAVAVAIVALGLAAWALWRSVARRRLVAIGAIVATVVGIAVAGDGVEARYRRSRYTHSTGELGLSWRWAQTVSHSRIGVVGLYAQYPYVGSDLTNYVQYVGVPTPHDGFARAPSCRSWRTAVDAGHYQYIVTSPADGIGPQPIPPEATWTSADPAAHIIVRSASSRTLVFRIDGNLNPATC
jgi:hypothetical protein